MVEPRPTLLHVDDSSAQLALTKAYLSEDYEVLQAMQPEAGLSVARQSCPDVIILDLMMPGMTGLEFLRALRTDPTTFAIPVVILSIAGSAAIGDEFDDDVFAVLKKPVDGPLLKQTVLRASRSNQWYTET